MMDQPVWSMTDDDGNVMSANEAEARMCNVISDPRLAHRYWGELGRVDIGLQVLALIVNPSLREKLWDTIDDRIRFWFVFDDSIKGNEFSNPDCSQEQ